MIADPPLLAGGDHETVAVLSPTEAITDVGLPGTVLGVTAPEAVEALEVCSPAFFAVTVNV